MDQPRAGLDALIAQCRKLEAALPGQDEPTSSAAMHRFVAAMDARRTLVMAGGLGVGIGALDLLRHGAGSALAAFALVLVCAGTALALAIGVVSFMGGHAFGLVVLKRLALSLIAIGILGGIAWTQGDMRAVGPVVALLAGLGAWLVLNSNGFYVFAGYQMARRYMEREKGE
jgi:hypothetical protein